MECGKQVSDTLRVCPHCNTKVPEGVTCGLCGEKLAISKAVGEKRFRSFEHDYYHAECFRQLVDTLFGGLQPECPECHWRSTLDSHDWTRAPDRHERDVPCENCGRRLSPFSCSRCGLPIIVPGHSYVEHKWQDRERDTHVLLYHAPTCYKPAGPVSGSVTIHGETGTPGCAPIVVFVTLIPAALMILT